MKNKKVILKKINKANGSTVSEMDCHCNCEGKVVQAVALSYIGNYL